MGIVWGFMIISSFLFAIYRGNLEEVIKTLFDSTNTATTLCFQIAGVLCLWSGFMKIAEKSGLVQSLSKMTEPIIKILFPELPPKSEASGHIAMNMTANILGLGNVATPMGLKAMQKLQEYNQHKDTLSNAMLMFLVLNTASIQLIPTSVIALRSNYGSQNPTSIVLPTILSSVISVIVGILCVKLVSKKESK